MTNEQNTTILDQVMLKSVHTDLLQTEDKCLGTLNLVDLPSLTHSLLDDVTIIIVVLQVNKKTSLGHENQAWIHVIADVSIKKHKLLMYQHPT